MNLLKDMIDEFNDDDEELDLDKISKDKQKKAY